MTSRMFAVYQLYFILNIAAFLSTTVFAQNIIKSQSSSGATDLSSKVSDLKTDGSNYGVGYGYYGPTPLPGYGVNGGLNYGNPILGTAAYLNKPTSYPTHIPTGYFPAAYTITGKPAIPYSGYVQPTYGYTGNLGYAGSLGTIGLGYPGVLGYNNVYDHHHPALPTHNYNGYQPYPNGFIG